jgi:hypothetical protein
MNTQDPGPRHTLLRITFNFLVVVGLWLGTVGLWLAVSSTTEASASPDTVRVVRAILGAAGSVTAAVALVGLAVLAKR